MKEASRRVATVAERMSEQEDDQASPKLVTENQDTNESMPAGEELQSSMVDETSLIKSSPEPMSQMIDSTKPTPFTKVGPPGLVQEEPSVLVGSNAPDGEDIIEDEMVKSEEHEEPIQANEQ